MPGLLYAPIHPCRRPVGAVLQVDRQAAKVGVSGSKLIAHLGQRLVERIRVHRGAEAIAATGKDQRSTGVAAPDVDRQVVAHLVHQQVAAIRADFVEPAEVLRPAPQKDADRLVGRKSTSAERVVVLPAIGASEESITLRRRATTAHSVAIRRPSTAPLPTISTADIGRGRDQW